MAMTRNARMVAGRLRMGIALTIALLAGGIPLALAPVPAAASSPPPSSFEAPDYTPGSIEGQQGWGGSGTAVSPSYDQEVVANGVGAPPSFGAQSFRMSTAVTSGSFGDWVFSPSAPDEAGETAAANAAACPGGPARPASPRSGTSRRPSPASTSPTCRSASAPTGATAPA